MLKRFPFCRFHRAVSFPRSTQGIPESRALAFGVRPGSCASWYPTSPSPHLGDGRNSQSKAWYNQSAVLIFLSNVRIIVPARVFPSTGHFPRSQLVKLLAFALPPCGKEYLFPSPTQDGILFARQVVSDPVLQTHLTINFLESH